MHPESCLCLRCPAVTCPRTARPLPCCVIAQRVDSMAIHSTHFILLWQGLSVFYVLKNNLEFLILLALPLLGLQACPLCLLYVVLGWTPGLHAC